MPPYHLRRRLRYFWSGMDSDGVELLSAALSATLAILLSYRRPGTTPLDHAHVYAALCALAGLAKAVGVLLEWRYLRLLGLLLGVVFWTTLSFVLVHGRGNSIAWLSFAVLALAQLWAMRRVWSP